MTRLLIVYHSRTGASQQMAMAAFEAAREEVETRLVTADAARAEDMLAAEGYIFAAPENLAALSGTMKEFFDRSYYPLLGAVEGRPYAQMIAAGSDGTNAARQLERIVTGWRLRAIQPPLIVKTHANTQEAILAPKTLSRGQLLPCQQIGQMMGAGLSMGVF